MQKEPFLPWKNGARDQGSCHCTGNSVFSATEIVLKIVKYECSLKEEVSACVIAVLASGTQFKEEVAMEVTAKKQIFHPHVLKQEGICGGRSIIEDTRIPVWSIIKWYKLGISIEDIIREFPQLTPSQVHDAFSYYYDNLDEIEKDILENENETYLRETMK